MLGGSDNEKEKNRPRISSKFPPDPACVLDKANVAAILWTEHFRFFKRPGLLWGEPSPLSNIYAFNRVKMDLTTDIQCICHEDNKIHALLHGLPQGQFLYSQIKPSINFVFRNAAF